MQSVYNTDLSCAESRKVLSMYSTTLDPVDFEKLASPERLSEMMPCTLSS